MTTESRITRAESQGLCRLLRTQRLEFIPALTIKAELETGRFCRKEQIEHETSMASPALLATSPLLDRNMATGTDSGSPTVRTVRQALRMNRNKVDIAAGTLTCYKEDDVTASHTAVVTTTAGNPITTLDPA